MTRFAKVALPVVLLLGASLIAAFLIQSRPEARQRAAAPPALLVDVINARRQAVTFEVTTQGTVTPRTETVFISEVAGQIIEVAPSFVAGGQFEKGDVLVRIDPRIYESQVKRAGANVAKARTQVATENALAGYALKDWERLREFDDDAKPASDLLLRKPQLAAALAELESALAEFEKAEGDLERTVVRAPYDGIIREKLADVGQYVNSAAPVAAAFATDYAEVRLPLTQQDLRYVDVPEWGQKDSHNPAVELSAEIGGEIHRWDAVLVRTEAVFDPETRVIHAVAQVSDPYNIHTRRPEPLRIGTFVAARISGRGAGDLFVLPRHALYRGNTVWLVDDERRIFASPVNVVRSDETSVFISDGLEDDAKVCITPIDQPLPGMPVRFRDGS
jgi:RND family efflux transporter MFP subunit